MIEIDLTKLDTTGLVRKKVLVRKKGSKPFWSTRWVQPGADIKQVVTSLGYEVVEEEEPKPEITKIPKIDITPETKYPGVIETINSYSDIIFDNETKLRDLIDSIGGKEGERSFNDQMTIDYAERDLKDAMNNRATMKRKYDELLESEKPKPEIEEEPKIEEKRVPTDRVHLQGVGDAPSIPASEVRVGDDRMFNYGGTEKIIAVDQKSPKTLLFTYDHIDSAIGKNYTQSVRASAKIAIKELYDDEVKSQREARKKRQAAEPKIEPKSEPEIIIPEPVIDVKPESVVETFQETLVPLSGDFVPSTTVNDATERIDNQFVRTPSKELVESSMRLDYPGMGVDFKGLKLNDMNSIINGLEKTIGKYGLKVDYAGWNPRKQSVIAKYAHTVNGLHHSLQFQKTATKTVKKSNEKFVRSFDRHKSAQIEELNRHLTYKEMRPGDHERKRDKLTKMESCDRYLVSTSAADPLAVVAAHEGMHYVYGSYNLADKWRENLVELVGRKMCDEIQCASVSEYGMSSVSELFAEVGAAVTFGIDIDPAVKQAFEKTMEGL